MNKLIKLLDQRAVDYAMSVCDANGVYKGKEYLTVVKEKFAQLIVQECAEIAYNKQYKHSAAHTRGDCAEAIKQHFGVEK